ncbi:SLC13 family permease [Lentibacillus amyloliquefaciens]|uniref:Potassium transporter TrkA n=1 Tax=Lentibacillus amyloliquefaciens TaxID=1472767 RepID=A0A0U3WAH2_9BACI|nr:SLC13 family permease [Lentibacillus amyloliquefaciens]ALX50112.1 potassium transporter TrkA [Lentibacillus amyloliquefaciens]
MSFEMIVVLILIAAMLAGLIFEVARPDMVIFSVLVILLLTDILTVDEALSGFSNEGMLTVALLFIVAGAVQKSGLIDQMMAKWLENSRTQTGTMLRFFVPTSAFSAFLNNTPIVVTFTPIIKNWCEKHGIAPSKFLIPLSYATILGGTITLMGTSTNLVVHGLLLDFGMEGFSLFTLAVVGVPAAVVGLIYLFTIGYKLLPDNKGFSQQIKEDSKEYIAEMQVTPDFDHLDKSVKDAGLRDLKGLYLIEIIRDTERISPVRSTTVIQNGDRLIFTGLISTIADLQRKKGLRLETGTNIDLDDLKNGTTSLVEAVVSDQSSLLTRSIKQSQFRSKYDAGVIAVHRNNERIQSKVGDIVLKPGDSLLLLAGADFVEKYQQSNDFFVVSSLDTPAALKQNPVKGWFSIIVLLALILTVTLGWLSMFKAMALAVVVFLGTKIITPQEAKQYVHFNVLLLIASALGVGVAMRKTGLAEWIAEVLLEFGEPLGLVAILFILYILTNVFTELITNSAAAVLMLPIGLEMAQTLGYDPMGFAVVIAIAASASFITPIGYQTNLIVYGPGGYKFTDYVKVGLPLSILVMLTAVLIIYNVWF